MESQTLGQPTQTVLQPSRRQSSDVNAISRSSRAQSDRLLTPSPFLSLSLLLGIFSWIISLVSQAVVAATFSNASVRLLWFGIVIQFILLVEVFEVVISGMFAYGVQISIFAGLATVFAVLGVDQNIYSSRPSQIVVGAGWLITAIIDLFLIIYFTSPADSHFIRLASNLTSFSKPTHPPKTVEKIPRSQDAFTMAPANGVDNNAGPGAEASIALGLDANEYAAMAAVDTDKLKEERMRGPDRTAGYDPDNTRPRIKSGGVWSNSTTSTVPLGNRGTASRVSSGVTDGAQGAERAISAQGSERETNIRPQSENIGQKSENTGVAPPETLSPSSQKATQSKVSRTASQTPTLVQPQTLEEPIAQWKAEAQFDYMGAADDPHELSFKKGEYLAIIDKSGKWWEARNMAGKKGIVPSNYLRLLE